MTTLERIRDTASTLFAARGYAGTSMSRLAGQVGIRKASLYNYYPSKEALLQDLVARGMSAWTEASESLQEGGDPRERLRVYFHSIFAFADAHPEIVALIRVASTQIGGSLGKRCRGSAVEEQGRMVDEVAELCRRAMEQGQMEAADPREPALLWTAVVDGVLMNKLFATPRAAEFGDRLEPLWRRLWVAMGGVT